MACSFGTLSSGHVASPALSRDVSEVIIRHGAVCRPSRQTADQDPEKGDSESCCDAEDQQLPGQDEVTRIHKGDGIADGLENVSLKESKF